MPIHQIHRFLLNKKTIFYSTDSTQFMQTATSRIMKDLSVNKTEALLI